MRLRDWLLKLTRARKLQQIVNHRHAVYEVWSPQISSDVAHQLWNMLEEDKKIHGQSQRNANSDGH